MDKTKAIELAEEIIRLDLLRDEKLERLETMVGIKAFEFLRWVQNGGFGQVE